MIVEIRRYHSLTRARGALQLFASRVFSHPNAILVLDLAKTALLQNSPVIGQLVGPNLASRPALSKAGYADAVTPFPGTLVLFPGIILGRFCSIVVIRRYHSSTWDSCITE